MNIHDATERAYRNGYAKGREDALAADVVEVVRCKDCKHWVGEDTKDYLLGERWGECHRPFGSYGCENSTENDFCSYGERREVCEKD